MEPRLARLQRAADRIPAGATCHLPAGLTRASASRTPASGPASGPAGSPAAAGA